MTSSSNASIFSWLFCVLIVSALAIVLVVRPPQRVGVTSIAPDSLKAKPIVYARIFFPNRRRQLGPPVRNFVYIKTHKTGSSSIREMLRKVIKERNLIEVVPKGNEFSHSWNPSSYHHSHKPGEYNALIAHSRFAPEVTNRLIRNPIYFTVLRYPESLFLSAFDFFPEVRQCAGGVRVTAIDVLDNPSEYYPKLQKCPAHYRILNSMAYDMGLEPPYSESDVRAKIIEMEKTFSLVMLLEHNEESMVMLRRTLNWNLSDVVSMPANTHPTFRTDDKNLSDYEKLVGHHEANVLTEKHKQVLRLWLHADFLIYEHFLKVFQEKVREEEKETGDLFAEVEMYKEAMVALCKGKDHPLMSANVHRGQRPNMVKWYKNAAN